MSQSSWEQAGKVKRTRKRRRVLLTSLLTLLILVVLLVVLAPTIASPFVPGIVESKGSAAVKGSVEVDSVSLSWFGPQRVRGLRIVDPGRQVVADVDVTAGVGLLSLAMGGRDLGTITVSGDALIRRDAQGQINVVEATSPAAPKPAPTPKPADKPASVPAEMRATLDLAGLNMTYTDAALEAQGIRSVALVGLSGTADFQPGAPIVVDLSGTLNADGTADDQGAIKIRATVDKAVSTDGTITIDQATVDANVTVDRLNPQLLDRLSTAPIDAVRAAGSKIDVIVKASGALARPDASLDVKSANVTARGAIGFDAHMLVVRQPVVVTLNQSALGAIDRDWLASVTGGSLDVHAMPNVELTLSALRFPIDGSGIGSVGVQGGVALGPLDAGVRVGQGESAIARRITTQPATFTVSSESLARGLTSTGRLAFKVDGADAGTLTLDLAAAGLLDEQGSVQSGRLPELRGKLAIEGVDTAVIQPFIAASGLDAVREIGPRLSLGLELTPQSGVTGVHGFVTSDNINGDLNLALSGTRLTGAEMPSRLRVGSLGPLLSRLLEKQGVRVREGAAFDLMLQQLDVDLAGLLESRPLAPRDVSALAEVMVGPTSGVFVDQQSTRIFSIEQVGVLAQFTGAARSALVRMASGGTIDGQPVGSITAEFRVDEFVASDGSWTFGMPTSIRGRAELAQIATSLIEPYLKVEGMTARDLIGPSIDLLLEAAPSGNATGISLTLTSEQITGDGAFLLTPDAIALGAGGLTFTHASLGPALASLVKVGQTGSVRPAGGSLEATLSRLNLPLDPKTRAPLLDQLDVASRVAVREIHFDRTGIAADDQLELRQLVLKAQVRPGAPATLETNAVFYNRRRQFAAEGAFQAPGFAAALTARTFDIATLKPSGRLSAPELPGSLLAEGIRMADLQGVDAEALAADIAGEKFALTINVAAEADKINTTVSATGQRLQLDAGATLASTLERANFVTEIKLSRPSTEQLMRAFLPQMAGSVGIVGTTALRLEGSLSPQQAIEASVRVPAITLAGLEDQPLRFALDSTVKTSLPTDPKAARPLAVVFSANVEDPQRRAVAAVSGNLNATLGGSSAPPMSGTLTASGLRTAWADKLLGSQDLYQGLLGRTLAVTADASIDQATQATRIAADIQAPNLKSNSKLSATLRRGAVLLDQPYAAVWTGDAAWLSRRLSGALADKAPSVDAPLRVELDLRQLTLPSTTQKQDGVNLGVDLALRVPLADLTMPGGEKRAYRTILLTARTNAQGTGVDATLTGDLRVGEASPLRAIDLTANVRRLVGNGLLTPGESFVNADGRLEHIPTSIMDALAGANGLLSDMLGPEVAVEDIKVRRAPLEGGTVAFKARSPNALAQLGGTFKDEREDGQLVDGFFVVDAGSFVELSAFEASFTKSIFDVVPIFGSMERSPEADRPSRITIESMSLPMAGGLEDIDFALVADLGTVQYGLSGAIESALKWTGQRSAGRLGGKILPFNVSMGQGILRYDNLNVPLGEFPFSSNGTINLVSKTKDLLILMPAGQFAVEAFGIQGVVADFVNDSVKIPMNNAGALDARTWKPDFSKSQGQLFAPEKILDEGLRGRLGDLLKPRGTGGQSGGGGGGGGG
ncbi:MAG: hypothetical protein DYG94_00090 [Leptolyngbya sp. PLA3]|nr:MAG: hypothetical protein EDM82_01785 [Cyanobacteria bacterium CYA]MCE7967136.1 hypothetical protein [Leptolyngbya sp. PL-A3]